MRQYVVDASVAIKWFIDEEHAPAARRLLDDRYDLYAPDLWLPECANILWKKVQRGELTTQEARLIRGGLEKQVVNILPSRLIIEPAFELALETFRSVYDCCYLALALMMECQLATNDLRLVNSLQNTPYAAHLLSIDKLD